ncbi:MAG: NADH-quinone oxidoreductase subunit NuoK [Oligoflexia bacterium]|nr:NADH-quinone oxidoreductase subunit NuoK [Oligoflexia bacterium]
MEKFYYLQILSAFLFCIGFLIIIVRKNIILQLIGIELMLNASNISFVSFSKQNLFLVGQVATLLTITIAAAETAIGLSILILLYRNFGSIQNEQAQILKDTKGY